MSNAYLTVSIFFAVPQIHPPFGCSFSLWVLGAFAGYKFSYISTDSDVLFEILLGLSCHQSSF